jgi:hypothetical protein
LASPPQSAVETAEIKRVLVPLEWPGRYLDVLRRYEFGYLVHPKIWIRNGINAFNSVEPWSIQAMYPSHRWNKTSRTMRPGSSGQLHGACCLESTSGHAVVLAFGYRIPKNRDEVPLSLLAWVKLVQVDEQKSLSELYLEAEEVAVKVPFPLGLIGTNSSFKADSAKADSRCIVGEYIIAVTLAKEFIMGEFVFVVGISGLERWDALEARPT